MTKADIPERAGISAARPDHQFVVIRTSAEETVALRRAVLRPHFTLEQMVVAGDENPDTAYLAVRAPAGDGAILGCLRLQPMPCPWAQAFDEAASPNPGRERCGIRPARCNSNWQLRAMATDPSARGTGLGRRLVEAAVTYVAERGGDLIWCNARNSAEGFYARLGFRTVTDRFALPDVAEDHVGMVLGLRR